MVEYVILMMLACIGVIVPIIARVGAALSLTPIETALHVTAVCIGLPAATALLSFGNWIIGAIQYSRGKNQHLPDLLLAIPIGLGVIAVAPGLLLFGANLLPPLSISVSIWLVVLFIGVLFLVYQERQAQARMLRQALERQHEQKPRQSV